MNITQLNIIMADSKLRDDLLLLIKRKLEIDLSIESYQDDISDIIKNAQAIGLKPTEFRQIVKDFAKPECVLNQLEYLNILNDNLIEG